MLKIRATTTRQVPATDDIPAHEVHEASNESARSVPGEGPARFYVFKSDADDLFTGDTLSRLALKIRQQDPNSLCLALGTQDSFEIYEEIVE